MKTTALIVAAGAGARMALRRPKAFIDLAGRPLLEHSLALFQDHPRVDRIVVMAPRDDVARAEAIAQRYAKVAAVHAGGERRQDTVRIGLDRIAELEPTGPDDLVLVHDAARPLADAALVSRVVEAAARTGAAVPGITPSDTVRRLDPAGPGGAVGRSAGTLDRRLVVLVQTPQGFRLSLLREACSRAGVGDVTDEATLVELMGGEVTVVEGSPRNLKVTLPHDLTLAEALIARTGED